MATNDSVNVPDYEEDVNEFESVQMDSRENQGDDHGKDDIPHGNPGRGSGSSSAKRSGKRSTKSDKNADTNAEEEENLKKREAFTSTLERGLKKRLNGLVHHAQTVGTPPGVATVADFINHAVANQLRADERKYNGGNAFPEPQHLRTGRPRR